MKGPPSSLAAAVATAVGNSLPPAVSAWSVIPLRDANPNANALLAVVAAGGGPRRSGGPGWALRAVPDDSDKDEEGAAFGDGDSAGGERRRKRDVLRHAMGLGSVGGDEPVRLSTEDLFKGMPSMESMLGGQPTIFEEMPEMPPSASDGGRTGIIHDDVLDLEEDTLRQQGQSRGEPNLLAPEDVASLESKYETMRFESERLVSSELSKDPAASSSELLDEWGKPLNITKEEAKKIVDYAVEEEKLEEKRRLNALRKEELVRGWENESHLREELMERELASSGDEGDAILENDGVTREIMANAEERENSTRQRESKTKELDFYRRQILQRREVEGVVEKAAEKNEGADVDDVYEEALDQIQSSRREKLGPKTLGVLANSIALEEGREYIRSQKKMKEFLKDVEQEAGLEDASDEEVARFFRSPGDYEEERMYRSIVRQIVGRRLVAEPTFNASSSPEASDNEEVDSVTTAAPVEDTKSKYQLSAAETVEAYKLLNLWREVQSHQDELERALGMKDEEAAIANRASNRLEPFFLYEEDSEERRRQEKVNLAKLLRRGLATDDNVESSSNELLMTELLEGGITRDRAVRLLDKLLDKAERGSTIRASLEELKRTILEENEDLAVEDEGDEAASPWLFRKRKRLGRPLDLSETFRTSDAAVEEDEAPPQLTRSSKVEAGGRTMPAWANNDERVVPPPPLPNTQFFASGEAGEAAVVAGVKAPNTPFFRSTNQEVVESPPSNKVPTGGMFGTYEEQKLKKLADRVGAGTKEEMEELRRNMEALKEAEELASAQLSDEDFDIAAASAKLGIDVNSLNLDDDDDDQIMSVIGKRPVSTTSESITSSADQTRKAILEFKEEKPNDIIVDAEGHLTKMKDNSKSKGVDIADDVFRAKTAGKYRSKEARDAAEEEYRDLVRMEEEAGRKLDLLGDKTLLGDIDVDSYAEDIMSEIKPRPRVRGRREDFMSREDIQKERKKESLFGDDDPFPVRGNGQPMMSSSGSGEMPEWFLKEQEALGIKAEDIDEEDYEEAQRAWEREERQLKADEYLKRRGEGISISDVLGREYFGPMDEPDDDYYQTQSSFDSFEARKELLLGYTELTVEDINNVIDYKVDEFATGYNRYLPRVQRPFSDYGAIFRLEGVLVDMAGMHAVAWKKVAEAQGYPIESGEEIRKASLYRPEDAVKEVYYWTDDVLELRKIAEMHQTAFQEAFDEWLSSGGDVACGDDPDFTAADPSPSNPISGPAKAIPSDEEMNSMYYLAWSKLAKNLDRKAPSNDQVYRGVMGGDWEVAVKDIFGWSQDPSEVYDIVVSYDEILQADYKVLLAKYGIDLDALDLEQEESQFGQFPHLSLKGGVSEWLGMLSEVDMPCAVASHLASSQLNAVLDATGLARYFPPNTRVSSTSNYSSERSELLGAALRLEQRPDKCVVFDNTPHSANEAHEVCMKVVSLVDHYARYELLTADLSVGNARDLNLISFVKLFNERTDMEPVPELDVNSGLQKQQRKAKTAFWDE